MKTVCKKLLCLMLVAMLLVSAVPAAFAAGTVKLVVETGLGSTVRNEYDVSSEVDTSGDIAVGDALLEKYHTYDQDKYAHEGNWWVGGGTLSGGKVHVGDNNVTIAIRLYEICECGEELIKSADFVCSEAPAVTQHTVTIRVEMQDDSGVLGTASKKYDEGSTVTLDELLALTGIDMTKYNRAGVHIGGTYTNNTSFTVTKDMTVTVYVSPKNTSGGGSGTGGSGTGGSGSGGSGSGSGESQPLPPANTKCKLTINYNLEGYAVSTVNAYKGYKYKEYVGVPARGGYDFLGWYSTSYDRFIDIEKDIIRGDDTIEAYWSGAKSFSLTFDVNRHGVEPINTLKRVTYGQKIGTLPTPTAPKGIAFVGWKLNGKMINADSIYELQGDATAYAVWALADDSGRPIHGTGDLIKGRVYLEIYTNNDTKTIVKRVDITSYADDYVITKAEVEKVVTSKKLVTPKSGYSLKYIGLFDEQGWYDYTHDPETKGEDYIIVNRDGDDYVSVMINNVKTVAADTTNPKTGDYITIAVSTMALAGAALVTITALKKRKMI